jgi:hypothetical protein
MNILSRLFQGRPPIIELQDYEAAIAKHGSALAAIAATPIDELHEEWAFSQVVKLQLAALKELAEK